MRLSLREKIMVLASTLLFVIIVGFFLVPYINNKIEALEQKNKKARMNLNTMLSLKSEYSIYKSRVDMMRDNSKEGIPILSILEDVALKAMINKENIVRIKPFTTPLDDNFQESSAEVKLENVTLKQLFDYLYKIENSSKTPMHTKRLQIKRRYDNPRYLDVIFEVSIVEPI